LVATVPTWIVTVSIDPPSEIVSVSRKLSVEVVDDFFAMLDSEEREVEVEITVVLDMTVVMMKVIVEDDVAVAVLEGGGLTGGWTIGDVVFLAGHPGDPESRRTGQLICRESMPFQATTG